MVEVCQFHNSDLYFQNSGPKALVVEMMQPSKGAKKSEDQTIGQRTKSQNLPEASLTNAGQGKVVIICPRIDTRAIECWIPTSIGPVSTDNSQCASHELDSILLQSASLLLQTKDCSSSTPVLD
jgi:hypothetical protein